MSKEDVKRVISDKLVDIVMKTGIIKQSVDISEEDELYYEKIQNLLPELRSYKKQTIRHIKKYASEQGYENLREFYDALCGDSSEVDDLKLNLTLKGSHFFRGKDWEYFNRHCLSTFRDRDQVRIWCAGCSSGEEVYSVIMSLMDYLPLGKMDVLATDYDDTLLQKCREGTYGHSHYKEIPERYRHYLVEQKKGRRFSFKKEIIDIVQTENLNLLTDDYPSGFDIILCRNVIKFFAQEVIPDVQRRLVDSLNSGGYLFLSVDGKRNYCETISDPKEMQLVRLAGRPIYRKN